MSQFGRRVWRAWRGSPHPPCGTPPPVPKGRPPSYYRPDCRSEVERPHRVWANRGADLRPLAR